MAPGPQHVSRRDDFVKDPVVVDFMQLALTKAGGCVIVLAVGQRGGGLETTVVSNREYGVTDQDLDQLSSLFRLLADKTRLGILLRLADGERNVTGLCADLRLPQPTVSHHLGLLRMNNVVSNRRRGKEVLYGLNGQDHSGAMMRFSVQRFTVQLQARR